MGQIYKQPQEETKMKLNTTLREGKVGLKGKRG